MGYSDVVFPNGTRVLVTGGAGFIGSNIAEALLEKGCFVRVLDDFSTGYKRNVEHLLANPDFELTAGDIRDYDVCQAACSGMDYVSHQAAWGSVPRSIIYPQLYCDINVKGTLNMLEAARREGVKRFVYASSSSVYGDSSTLPKKEGNEGSPLSPYALTKKLCEEYAALYYSLYGLSTVGLRYFNVFGKRQDPNGAYAAVIPRFIRQLLSGDTPVIYGDGEQSRDFTYIANVVEANMKAMTAEGARLGRAYNIACGASVKLSALYKVIAHALENGVRPIPQKPLFAKAREGDVRSSIADITDARRCLGYSPSYSFAEGMKLTIDWYVDNL